MSGRTVRLEVGKESMAQPTKVKDARPAAHSEAHRLLAKAKELAPFFSAQAPHNEAKGSLTDKTLSALREGGFFSMLVPRHFGGAEIWPLEASEIFETVCHADGATGWVLIVTQVSLGTVGAYLDLAAAQEIFAKGIPLIAGQGGPQGQAIVDGRGFRLSGRWGYGSGVLHADYLYSGAHVIENGKPRMLPDGSGPDVRVFIVPRREVVFHDNWDVLGLRATASVDYAMTDVYVPEEFSFHPATTKPKQGGNLYRISVMGMVGIGHASYYLGVARRLLDELAKLATAKSGRPSVLSTPGGGESFQEQYGAAEAKLRAARCLHARGVERDRGSDRKGSRALNAPDHALPACPQSRLDDGGGDRELCLQIRRRGRAARRTFAARLPRYPRGHAAYPHLTRSPARMRTRIARRGARRNLGSLWPDRPFLTSVRPRTG